MGVGPSSHQKKQLGEINHVITPLKLGRNNPRYQPISGHLWGPHVTPFITIVVLGAHKLYYSWLILKFGGKLKLWRDEKPEINKKITWLWANPSKSLMQCSAPRDLSDTSSSKLTWVNKNYHDNPQSSCLAVICCYNWTHLSLGRKTFFFHLFSWFWGPKGFQTTQKISEVQKKKIPGNGMFSALSQETMLLWLWPKWFQALVTG